WRGILPEFREARRDVLAVIVEDVELLFLVEELHRADNRHQVVALLSRLGADRAAGAWCFGAEHDVFRRALLYRCFEEVGVERACIEEQILRQILLRQVVVALDEAVERAAAMADHNLEAGEALEHVAMRQKLRREILLPHETDLIILRDR